MNLRSALGELNIGIAQSVVPPSQDHSGLPLLSVSSNANVVSHVYGINQPVLGDDDREVSGGNALVHPAKPPIWRLRGEDINQDVPWVPAPIIVDHMHPTILIYSYGWHKLIRRLGDG